MEKVYLEGYALKENKKENIFACQIFLTCVRKGRCVKKIYGSTVACDFFICLLFVKISFERAIN